MQMHIIQNTPIKAAPLDKLTIAAHGPVQVTDAAGRQYFTCNATGSTTFTVGGTLGEHTIKHLDAAGNILTTSTFQVDAKTTIRDNEGVFSELFAMLEHTMRYCFTTDGTGASPTPYQGKDYYSFVVWILDHVHTAKGFQYFSRHADGLVNLLKEIQREDGMIWSFVYPNAYGQYFRSAYEKPFGYAKEIEPGGHVAGRQPVENHCEYNYVECAHLVWKSSGNDQWMGDILESCKAALDYTINSNVRWSDKYQLLKRGYTIDSWDFQPNDEYLPEFPLGRQMQIDPARTKFTIFYGDNTGYALACDKLAEMLEYTGQHEEASKYSNRAQGIRTRLDKIAWNGQFYRHRIEEDDTVKRDLGADEGAQISFSNCYTLNRGCTQEQAAAIIKTYMNIKDNLPPGSPGEFYSIYPPFDKPVFGSGDNHKWQYMNGGVHGHAAGELARGAFKHGYEKYGVDILKRISEMGKKSQGMLRFAYTGAYEPPPPAQVFETVDLSEYANMSLSSQSDTPWMFDELKNEIPTFPTGRFVHDGVPFDVTKPASHNGNSAAAISTRQGLPHEIRVGLPAQQQAGSIYLLHATAHSTESGLVALVVFEYADGTTSTRAIKYDENITNFCFAHLEGKDHAGVAWKGENQQFYGVAMLWAEITNPEPKKPINAIRFQAGPDGAYYAVLGLTLSDRAAYKKPPFESTGGPDNWSGGLCMAALIEGLAGVSDSPQTTKFSKGIIAPRWVAADTSAVHFTARYEASDGYIAYDFTHNAASKRITMVATGSGESADFRVLLPENATQGANVTLDGAAVPFTQEKTGESLYIVFHAKIHAPITVTVEYR